MRRRLVAYALILIATAVAAELVRYRPIEDRFAGMELAIHTARVAHGDDPRWAAPSWDDSAWEERLIYVLQGPHPMWLRRTITLDRADQDEPLSLYVSMIAATEIYWDGVLIGRSGRIDAKGRPAEAGPIDNFFSIDRSLRSPGPHLLAVRIAPGTVSHPPLAHGLAIGNSLTMLRSRLLYHALPIAGLGVFIVVGAWYAAMWMGSRRLRDLLFAMLCLAAGLLVLVECWRWMLGMTWDWQVTRLRITDGVTFAIAWLLPTFFAVDFGLRRPGRWAAGFAGLLLLAALSASSFDERCLQLFSASIVLAAVVLVEAAPARRWEILPAAIGVGALAVSLVLGGYGFSDFAFFVAFAFLILCLLVSMAVQMKRQKAEHESALLRAARLEIELLQKSLQPHFLMNTLTAVMEWIEEDPATGVRFLQALADELSTFAEVANEKLIPLRRELELCRAHLEIMGCRKETRFLLETSGLSPDSLVPPATFHTLLENAITHNRYEGDSVTFTLRGDRDGDVERYTLDAPLRGSSRTTAEGGLGLKYIRARLEESFPGRWKLEDGAIGGAWRTVIEVPA
jgi:hypothetical protein